MGTITLVGCGTVVLLAVATDSKAAIQLISIVVTVRGVTFLAKKVTQTINKDCADLIDFAGWSFAGISGIKLLKLAYAQVSPVVANMQKFADFIDKLTPWN